jgi:hypothetical protein
MRKTIKLDYVEFEGIRHWFPRGKYKQYVDNIFKEEVNKTDLEIHLKTPHFVEHSNVLCDSRFLPCGAD